MRYVGFIPTFKKQTYTVMLLAGITAGLGLLGGALSSQRKFHGYGAIDKLMKELANPGKNLDYFQRIAQDAGPSQNDLLSLAAATGGSNAAAVGQASQASLQAADQGLASFERYRQSLDGLRANLAMGKTQMMQNDFNTRRSELTSLFSNIATAGTGMMGNELGFNQQAGWLSNNGLNPSPMGGSGGMGSFNAQPMSTSSYSSPIGLAAGLNKMGTDNGPLYKGWSPWRS